MLGRLDHVAGPHRKRAEALEAHPERRCTTKQYGRSMKARPQCRGRETAILVERAQRVLCEFRKLLEQREMQLEQQEQFVEQRATITDEILVDTATLATPL